MVYQSSLSSSNQHPPFYRSHHHHHHPYAHNLRWLLIGAILGSALTQLLVYLSTPSSVSHVHNNGIVGYYDDDGALHLGSHQFHYHYPEKQHKLLPVVGEEATTNTSATRTTIASIGIPKLNNSDAAKEEVEVVLSDDAQEKDYKKKAELPQPQTAAAAAAAAGETPQQPAREGNTTSTSTSNQNNNNNNNNTEEEEKGKKVPIPDIAFEPIFVDLPPPPKLEKDEYVSACLLIKDDNHWLIEWLAYHYHALPLRELIVVVDPDSKTSPKKIFDRWTSRKLMNITVWDDKDFMPDKIKALPSAFDNNTGLMLHRIRQTNFIKKCVPELRKRVAKYVTLIDTDEFVIPSYSSWYFLNVTNAVPKYMPGNVLRLLKYHEQLTGTNHTCVFMPRYFFGARESKRPKFLQTFVPPDLDVKRLVTNRFIYREPKMNPNGKNLIHMERVPKIEQFGGVHKITSVCPDVSDMWKINQMHHSIIRVHHYLGTKEQHFFRDDPRVHDNNNQQQKKKKGEEKKPTTKQTGDNSNSKPATYIIRGMERYNRLNAAADHEDHGMLGWVHGFVKTVGGKTAKALLKDVGVVGVE